MYCICSEGYAATLRHSPQSVANAEITTYPQIAVYLPDRGDDVADLNAAQLGLEAYHRVLQVYSSSDVSSSQIILRGNLSESLPIVYSSPSLIATC